MSAVRNVHISTRYPESTILSTNPSQDIYRILHRFIPVRLADPALLLPLTVSVSGPYYYYYSYKVEQNNL